MLIRCPECRFERQIDENAIPANAAMATCPHCQYRFRFRNPDGTPVVDETPAAAPAQQTAPAGRPLPPDLDGDDPLPPGAMVPRIPGDHDASAPTPEAPETEPQKGQPEPPQNVAEKRSDFWNNFQKKRDGESKGKGYGRALMEYCLADARAKGKSGVCMLGAEKQKAWLSDQAFAKKFGFQTVDTAPNGYELLALSFDGTKPRFAPHAKKQQIENKELTVFYDMQCPYILQRVERVERYCGANGVPLSLVRVDTLQKAKELPCVFNNWAVFYKGKFETVNLLDDAALQRLLKK